MTPGSRVPSHVRVPTLSADFVAAVLTSRASEANAPAVDVVEFLYARLGDEAVAHHLRGAAGTPQAQRQARAADMLQDVLSDLDAGRPVEPWIVRTLLLCYRDHPDYRSEWDADVSSTPPSS